MKISKEFVKKLQLAKNSTQKKPITLRNEDKISENPYDQKFASIQQKSRRNLSMDNSQQSGLRKRNSVYQMSFEESDGF